MKLNWGTRDGRPHARGRQNGRLFTFSVDAKNVLMTAHYAPLVMSYVHPDGSTSPAFIIGEKAPTFTSVEAAQVIAQTLVDSWNGEITPDNGRS